MELTKAKKYNWPGTRLVFADLKDKRFLFSIDEPRGMCKVRVQTCLLAVFGYENSRRWDPANKQILAEMKKLKIAVANIKWFKNKVKIYTVEEVSKK